MDHYGVNMNGPWGSILGVVVVTLTGIYWMAANPHLRAFTKKRVEEYFGFETYIRTVSDLSAGVYMGNYWSGISLPESSVPPRRGQGQDNNT